MEGETRCSGSRLSDNVTIACICVVTEWKWVSLKKKKKNFFLRETPTSPWVPFRAKFRPLGRLFRPSRPLAWSLFGNNVFANKLIHILLYIDHQSGKQLGRASDFFQDWWAEVIIEQKMVGHLLKWWALAYQTNHSYLHTDTDTHMLLCILTADFTVKPVLSGHSKKTNYSLMQVKSVAECSKGSILQSFWPSLSFHLILRSLFCLFWVAA